MGKINLFCSSLDTKPRLLISHFARYLGFYVEEITKNTNIDTEDSSLDIYLISDNFVNENTVMFNPKFPHKTLCIGVEDYQIPQYSCIQWNTSNEVEFLKNLSYYITEMSVNTFINKRWLIDFDIIIDQFIQIYIQDKIFQVYQYSSIINKDFFNKTIQKYLHFIKKLEQIEESTKSNFIKYILCYTKFEVNCLSKLNNFSSPFNSKELYESCMSLLMEYRNNEMLHILCADINYLFLNKWNIADNEYSDYHIINLIYPYFQQANIAYSCLKDENSALQMYTQLVQAKPDYNDAWFKIATHYQKKIQWNMAKEAYENIYENLINGYSNNVLSPKEIIYFSSAIAHLINLNYTRNPQIASEYIQIFNHIQNTINEDTYFKLLWNNDEAYDNYFPLIQQSLKKTINSFDKDYHKSK